MRAICWVEFSSLIWHLVYWNALRPFPVEVRTLDGLHLATVEYLRSDGASIELATFDTRMTTAARGLGIAIYQP
jgi:hypothetical protein